MRELLYQLYPNPGNGQFMLSINSSDEELIDLKLLDVSGKQVYSKNLTIIKGNKNFWLDFTFLETGIYSLVLKSKETQTQTKLIIIK